MQYIERYIKTLSKNVEFYERESGSTYYILDGIFKIRVSNHVSPIGTIKSDLNIISLYNSPHFLVFHDGTLTPLVKTRKEVKNMIAIKYECKSILTLSKDAIKTSTIAKKKAKKEAEKAKKEGSVVSPTELPSMKLKMLMSRNLNRSYDALPKYLTADNWCTIGAALGQWHAFRTLNHEVKVSIKKTYETKKYTPEQVYHLIQSIEDNKHTKKAMDVIAEYKPISILTA